MTNLFPTENSYLNYQPKPAPHFNPDTIVLTKGSFQTTQQRAFVQAICDLYPQAQVLKEFALPHNRFDIGSTEPLESHYRGKKTLVFGVHKSALRFSDEDGNTCPNYWHFSPYGFCPYDCQYCYLAGTNEWAKLFHSNALDFNQTHPYAARSRYKGKLDELIVSSVRQRLSRYGKPVFIGESGLDARGPEMPLNVAERAHIGIRYAIWASVVSGAMNGRMLWCEDGYESVFTNRSSH